MKKLLFLLLTSLVLFGCGSGNDQIDSFCDGDILIPFQEKEGGKWGYINNAGEIIVKPKFKFQPTFCVGGNAVIRKENKEEEGYYQFIKVVNGKVTINEKKWDFAATFRDGLAPVRNKNEYVKFINEDYKVVFTANAMEVGYFNEGLAAFRNHKNKWGFYNKKGKVAIKAKYDFVESGFTDGYAIVGKHDKDDAQPEYKIIDTDGKTVLNLKSRYDHVRSIAEGYIRVEDDGWGFIDMEGSKVIKINDDWDYVTDFMNGYASYREDGKWGLIDEEGEEIIRSHFDAPLFVVDEKIWYLDDDEWGLMDLDGEDLIEPEFKSDIYPYPFMCGTAIIGDGRNDIIFVDEDGEETNKAQYASVGQFDYRMITTAAWNETFESDYFDPSLIEDIIDLDLMLDSTAVGILNELSIDVNERWNDGTAYGLSWRYTEDDGFQMYADDSDELELQLYEHSYDYGVRESGSQMERMEEYIGSLDISDEEKMERLEMMESMYSNEEVEKESSIYPKESTGALGDVRLTIDFDDYAAVTEIVAMDAIENVYEERYEEHTLVANKDARVNYIVLTIDLTEQGYDKADLLAKHLVKSWKGRIKEKIEEGDEDGYFYKGKLDDRTITIRSVSSDTVKITIESEDRYDFWGDEEEVEAVDWPY